MDEKKEEAFWGKKAKKRGIYVHESKNDKTGSPARSVPVSKPASAAVSREPSAVIGRRLAAMRRVVDHVCPTCDKEFEGIVTAKYCSNACRQRAKYRRKVEAITAPVTPTNGHFDLDDK